jgi:hypothetical protein
MADLNQLEAKLSKSLQEYQESVDAYLYGFRKEYCDEYDLLEIAKYVFYALSDFKTHIVKYLKETNKG